MCLEQFNKELDDIFSSIEFEENGGIRITGTDWYSDDLRIELSIKTGIEEQNQFWEIQVNGVKEELIKSHFSNRIELHKDHPLLWRYNQLQTSLYFGHSAARPYELFAEVYKVHLAEAKGWIPFERYISKILPELTKSDSGLFASGPITLMEAYKKVLEVHEMKPTIVGGHYPKKDVEDLKVLIIDYSYIIAESFDFTRV